MPSNSQSNNGLTQKEMLLMVLEGQDKLNERIDSLHEKVNAKISRQELAGWVVIVGTLSAIMTQM